MAAQLLRNRKDPVARFNTFEQPDPEIKAQIENASRTQRALRAQVPQWPSKHTPPEEDAEGLQPAPIASHRSKALETRSESVSVVGDADRNSLDRTFSFNSLSTLQRDAEATRLQQWRDSPVSAFSPIDRAGCPIPELKQDEQDQYPALAVYKLKQSRKDEKEQRKSIKKKEKQLKKAEKAAAHRRRHSMANDVAPDQAPLNPADNSRAASDTSSPPRRAISDPSFKTSLIKRLTAKPMAKLSRRSKIQQTEVPHIDDFPSKPDLKDYLNSELPEPNLPIAELPGPLPPYTPFENSTANENNSAISSDPAIVGSASVYRSPSAPHGHSYDPSEPPRMMRCDKCQFGIKLDEEYFHCKICQNGDRIICRACDADGESCRHELTKRRRYVLGYADGPQDNVSSRHNTRRRHDGSAKGADFSSSDDMHRLSNVSSSAHYGGSRSHHSRSAGYDVHDRRNLFDLKEIEIRRREQDVTFREREAFLREREAALRERQTQFQAREADAGRRSREQEATISKQYVEMATLLSTQVANLQAQFAHLSMSRPGSPSRVGSHAVVSDEEAVLDMSPEQGLRTHAGKRKASGKARTASNNTATGRSCRPTQESRQLSMQQDSPDDDDEGDEEESGTPKKIKQDPESAISPGKLYACHFCKHNSLRYSEKNNSEKQYRGCSSGYWPDISRLKQHLYRVHWRGHHCEQCFAVFKKSQDLQSHARTRGCQGQDCPFPEKFNHAKYNEIRKKRPTNTPEEVWYIIYDILFPGEVQPETPYADSIEDHAQSFSSPTISPALPTLDALGDAFDSRLDQYQDVPSQAWLRLPGAREFIREQLRASMADVLKHVTPTTTPAATPLQPGGSPSSPTRHESNRALSIAATSIPPSPVAQSATSSRSASSAQWRLPNHRRSFSRPLLPSMSHRASDGHHTRPTLTLETTKDSSEVSFAIATPADPENDSYDSESGSWHQNDDSSGLAITAGGFNFDFESCTAPLMSEMEKSQNFAAADGIPAPRSLQRSFEFRPVKVSTLVDVPEDTKQLMSKPVMIDSAYGSLDSSHGDGTNRPNRLHVKSATAFYNNPQISSQDLDVDMSVLEHELNMEALEIPFQQFLGAEMDECGNIEGKNLTEYLYGQGGLVQGGL